MMGTRKVAHLFGLIALMALAGCASRAVAVHDITADKMSYLHKNFSSERVTRGAIAAVTATDKAPLPFTKIVIDVTEKVAGIQKGLPSAAYQSVWTIVNAGGAFVEAIDEQKSNGIPTRQIYRFAYRNLFTLRTQTVPLNATSANAIMEVRAINLFTPVGSTDKPGYSYEWAMADDSKPGSHYQYYCQYGPSYQASTLHAKFGGMAQDLSCSFLNANGTPERQTVIAYLIQYGIGIPRQITATTSTTTYAIDDVEVQ
jgi:hypothetical protein